MNSFGNIKDIKIEDLTTWKDKIFLTFDLDWVIDPVLEETLDILDEYDLPATIFVTHETKLLDRMRKNPNIELGIHPNFNFLLEGDFRYGKTYEEVILYYKDIVPEAISLRSHSMTNNSRISNSLDKLGISYNCNYFIPYNAVKKIKPFAFWGSDLVIVPYIWEDDINLLYNDNYPIQNLLKDESLAVFDFHPIHIFLNSDSMEIYESSKADFTNIDKLANYVNTKNKGIKDKFLDLINFCVNR